MFNSSRALLLLLLVSLVGLSDLGDPVFAQGSDEKAQLAQKLVELHNQEGYLERALEAAVRNAPAGQKEAVEELISKLDQDALSAGFTKKVEEIYTIEELTAYLDFASTDVGRSIVRKSTEFAMAMQDVLAIEILAVMSEE